MITVCFLRLARLALFGLLSAAALAQRTPSFTSPLPTGVRLDAAGTAIELGSMPINFVLSPEGDKAAVVLSGWREQGIQIVDLKTQQVTQTLLQDGAFYGAAFSPDGHQLYVSGGNTDKLFVYSWDGRAASLTKTFVLATARSAEDTGTSYPAGVAVSPNGKFVYVAENVGDHLAVINSATGEIAQRFSTDHYPYAVAITAAGHVFVSAWGADSISEFSTLPDGTLVYIGRIVVGRHPSALVTSENTLYVALAGSTAAGHAIEQIILTRLERRCGHTAL